MGMTLGDMGKSQGQIRCSLVHIRNVDMANVSEGTSFLSYKGNKGETNFQTSKILYCKDLQLYNKIKLVHLVVLLVWITSQD